jgi:hypothetical protein
VETEAISQTVEEETITNRLTLVKMRIENGGSRMDIRGLKDV